MSAPWQPAQGGRRHTLPFWLRELLAFLVVLAFIALVGAAMFALVQPEPKLDLPRRHATW